VIDAERVTGSGLGQRFGQMVEGVAGADLGPVLRLNRKRFCEAVKARDMVWPHQRLSPTRRATSAKKSP